MPSLPDNSPNFLVDSELSQHVTPVAVVPDVVDDLVDDAASEISNATTAVPLHDERERYIDQLLAEIESLQVCMSELFLSLKEIEWLLSIESFTLSCIVLAQPFVLIH